MASSRERDSVPGTIVDALATSRCAAPGVCACSGGWVCAHNCSGRGDCHNWRVLVPCRLERHRLLGGGGLPSQLLGPWRVRWRSAYMHVRRGVLGWCVRGSPLHRLRGARPVPRSRRVQLRRGLRRLYVSRATLPAQLLRCERPWHVCGPQPVQMRCGLVGRRLLRGHLRRALWRSRQVHRRQPMRVRCGLEGCAL
jgi:hypothetical protein